MDSVLKKRLKDAVERIVEDQWILIDIASDLGESLSEGGQKDENKSYIQMKEINSIKNELGILIKKLKEI